MAMKTPDWILEGHDSKEADEKSKGIIKDKKTGKTFKIRECPKCNSDGVGVVIGENGIWECKKCEWKGEDINEKELNEDEFMKYLDEKGEEVAQDEKRKRIKKEMGK